MSSGTLLSILITASKPGQNPNVHRDFLLFIPSTEPGLREVMTYFSAQLKVNPEGDVLISDDTIQGLGIYIRNLLAPFFATFTCALVSIYEPQHRTERHHGFSTDQALDADFFWQEDVITKDHDFDVEHMDEDARRQSEPLLIAVIPHPGYFVAVSNHIL